MPFHRAFLLCLCTLTVACARDPAQSSDASDAGTDAGDVSQRDATMFLPEVVADPTEPTECAPAPPPVGMALARTIRCDGELARGPLAMGRIGDVLMENARIRVVIRRAAESATTVGAPGGGIVDAVPQQGERIDAVKEILPMLNFHGLAPGPITVVRASGSEAIVRATFEPRAIGLIAATIPSTFARPRVTGVLEYSMRADEAFVRMRICALVDGGSGVVPVAVSVYAQLGGSNEVVAAGHGVLEGEMGSAVARALIAENARNAIAIAPENDTATIVHVNTTNFVQATTPTRFEGVDAICGTLRIAVGSTGADVFAETAADPAGAMREIAVPAGGRAEVADAMGRLVLRSREASGIVRARVPAGANAVRVARPDGNFGDPSSPPPTGRIAIAATAASEDGAPIRITIVGLDGERIERRVSVTGAMSVTVPAGRYRVSASRGTEYDAVTREIDVPADGDVTFSTMLRRVLPTPGYVATDFHLHTELSTDSSHTLVDAVRQMAAEGLELVAGTDHDFVSDHDRVRREAGIGDWIVTVAGEEVSTTRLGHFGGYPLRVQTDRGGYGAVPWFGLGPAQLFGEIRARGDNPIVQVNHPRNRGSYFDAIGLDLTTGRATRLPAALGLPAETDLNRFDFDVLEVWNGYTRGGNEQSFTDFLALRVLGRRFTMIGNSDSHRADRAPGAPRTYVRVANDTRGMFTWADVRAGLASGDAIVSAGLFAELTTPGGARPGSTTAAMGGRATFHVRVSGPPWADCVRVRLYRNNTVAFDQAITTDPATLVRFEQDVTLDVAANDLVLLRADGRADAEPVFGWPPFSVTNPIRVVAP